MGDTVLRFDLNTPGTILLDGNLVPASQPYFALENSYASFTRYFLLPQSVIDLSKVEGLKKVVYGIKVSQNRTKGSSDTWVKAISGTLESQTSICDNLLVFSQSGETSLETGDYKDNTLFQKIKNGTALCEYNGQKYYCLKANGGPGGLLLKFTGTYSVNDFYIEATYEDTSKLFLGETPVTKAYIGTTPLNGIYLGNTKLL